VLPQWTAVDDGGVGTEKTQEGMEWIAVDRSSQRLLHIHVRVPPHPTQILFPSAPPPKHSISFLLLRPNIPHRLCSFTQTFYIFQPRPSIINAHALAAGGPQLTQRCWSRRKARSSSVAVPSSRVAQGTHKKKQARARASAQQLFQLQQQGKM